MENHKLQPLTELERMEAEQNHNLIYAFLHTYKYPVEEMYNVAVIGFLKGIQIYNRREELRTSYDQTFICWKYMQSECGNHFRKEQSKKRKPPENIISLDADYAETENLYNCISGKSLEDEYMESELLEELMENLSEIQRKIIQMKIFGYENKEIYFVLNVRQSTYYKELQKIKAVLEKLVS